MSYGTTYSESTYSEGGVSPAEPTVPFAPVSGFENLEALQLDAYQFLLAEIRRLDLNASQTGTGTRVLRRYVDMINAVWTRIFRRTQQIPQLWDIENVENDKLQYVKWIVGWTKTYPLQQITDAVTDDQLRRLIAVSGDLWRDRGPQEHITTILQLLTRARCRIWNWFDFRWVLGETNLTEDHDSYDPWLISLPSSVGSQTIVDESGVPATTRATGDASSVIVTNGVSGVETGHIFIVRSGPQNGVEAVIQGVVDGPPDTVTFVPGPTNGITGPLTSVKWEVVDRVTTASDEYRSNLRIVDDGNLDRTLVLRILRLLRACSERFDITYLSFLDQFIVDGDHLQWQNALNNVVVVGGTLSLSDSTVAESTYALVPESYTWNEYVVSARVRGPTASSGERFGLTFYRTSAINFYSAMVDLADQLIVVTKTVIGIESAVGIVDLSALGVTLDPDLYFMLRIAVTDLGASTQISVYIGGNLLGVLVDPTSAHSQGGVGVAHTVGTTIEVSEVEVAEFSQGTDTLEINTNP